MCIVIKRRKGATCSSQEWQRAASSAAQKTTAGALSQASQRIRIIYTHSHPLSLSQSKLVKTAVSFLCWERLVGGESDDDDDGKDWD